jgi:hypothetical protein
VRRSRAGPSESAAACTEPVTGASRARRSRRRSRSPRRCHAADDGAATLPRCAGPGERQRRWRRVLAGSDPAHPGIPPAQVGNASGPTTRCVIGEPGRTVSCEPLDPRGSEPRTSVSARSSR